MSEILAILQPKQSIHGVLQPATTQQSDYNKLNNKPKINGVELSGDVSLEDLDVAESADTLAGYGITDAYTKTEVDAAINELDGNIDVLIGSVSKFEASMKATRAYTVGDYINVHGKLYKANKAIASGATLSTSTNVDEVTIGDELKANAQSIATAAEQIASNAEEITNVKADLSEMYLKNVVEYSIENGSIYIASGYEFRPTSPSQIRVCTNPIFIPEGENVTIEGYGFEKYTYTLSSDGITNNGIRNQSYKVASQIHISFTGPIWFRFVFAYADDRAITPNDIVVKIYSGYGDVPNGVLVDSFGKYINIPKDTLGNQIIATHKRMYVRNNNGVLQLSKNGGKSWNAGVDVSAVGLIKTYHLYDDGTIAFFTHQRAYYCSDWMNYHEASVYEEDGTTQYSPSQYDNFTTTRDNKTRMYVGAQDAYVFGNYGITNEANTRRVIWASIDNGRSYKVIYEFNITGAYSIRHIHNVIYHPSYNCFLCATGDDYNQSHVLRIDYNQTNDAWTITKIASGPRYKWAGIAFYGAYIYYCCDNTPGAVYKCKFNDIADLTKHEIVINNLPNDPIGLFIGERGDMLITLSAHRSGQSNSPFSSMIDTQKIYYSVDRKTFHNFKGYRLNDYADSIYYGFMPVNDDGRVLCGYFSNGTTLDNWNKLPSVSLDLMVKRFGFPNAFKPYNRIYEVVPVVDVECDNVTVNNGSSITITPLLFPYDASSLAFEIIDYNASIISVSGATITGIAVGTTTAKVRSKTNYEAYAEITVTVS